ncbi:MULTISPECIES: hypothetical protein [unclassified Caballeronia]|uniref:hypothetical protein n=1 Tax=unclassified Caballeronia TaxID=2646786 RepID=UPI002027ADB5|nr:MULTISPECIES: hypothetical protein [unclassified Caballeronia]
MTEKKTNTATFDEILVDEKKHYLARRKELGVDSKADSRIGLALSGGGIRSACFCLGVISAMFTQGRWNEVDYVSSVSGGGYTAAALARRMKGNVRLNERMISECLERMKTRGGFLSSWLLPVIPFLLTFAFSVALPITAFLFVAATLAVAALQHLWLPAIAFGGGTIILLVCSFVCYFRKNDKFASFLDLTITYFVFSALFLIARSFGFSSSNALWLYASISAGLIFVALALLCATPDKPHIRRRQRLIKPAVLPVAMLSVTLCLLAGRGRIEGFGRWLGLENVSILTILIALGCALIVWVSPNALNGALLYYRFSLRFTFKPSWEKLFGLKLRDTASTETFPIHIINCFAQFSRVNGRSKDVLKKRFEGAPVDPINEMKRRGGVNFACTPHFCGSRATDYLATSRWESRGTFTSSAQDRFWTLVAASAAAVDTHPTRMSPLKRMTLAFLNIGLGVWVRNPAVTAKLATSWPSFTCNIRNFLEVNAPSDAWIRLSDGGHFENLGLYELVARKCTRIIVVDAGYDPNYEYFDLAIAARRCFEDFGATINLDIKRGQPTVVTRGKIEYGKGSKAIPAELIYIKLSALESHSLPLRLRAAYDAGFPHEPTVNQFVDDDFVQAYFSLGKESGEKAFRRDVADRGTSDMASSVVA